MNAPLVAEASFSLDFVIDCDDGQFINITPGGQIPP